MPLKDFTSSDSAAKSLKTAQTVRPQKVGFVSLGCPKNLVDSEVMMGLLARAGAELTTRAEDADVIVVNTCSFIETRSSKARSRSRSTRFWKWPPTRSAAGQRNSWSLAAW
jgi:hypothetical protein